MAVLYAATHVHIEADQFFYNCFGQLSIDRMQFPAAHRWAFSWTQMALASRENVVVANTFVTLAALLPYIHLGRRFGACIRVIEMRDQRYRPRGFSYARMATLRKEWESLSADDLTYMLPVTTEDPPVYLTHLRLDDLLWACQPGVCGSSWERNIAMPTEPSVCTGRM